MNNVVVDVVVVVDNRRSLSQVRMGGIQNGMALLSLTVHVPLFLSLSHTLIHTISQMQEGRQRE